MIRATRMCKGCPFRLRMSRDELDELARLSPEEFPCHTEAGYTTTDLQCRGHWEASRKALRRAQAAGVKVIQIEEGERR